MKKKTTLAIVLLAFLFPATFTAAIIPHSETAHAQPPAPSIYVLPTTESFNTSTAAIGTQFTVTLWGSTPATDQNGLQTEGWSARFSFDPALLQCVSVTLTGGANSQLFQSAVEAGAVTTGLSKNIDNTAGTVLCDEAIADPGPYIGAVTASLVDIEFNITAAPTPSQNLTCNIDPGYGITVDETFFLDTSIAEEAGLTTALCTYTFAYIQAQGTVYIRADGSIDPPTAPISSVDNITYMFTDNINGSIIVERDNILVDGAGYTVQGTGVSGPTGIDLSGRENVTVNNAQIISFSYGILLNSSSGNSISGNNITDNGFAIVLDSSVDNDIYHNNVINNTSQVSITEWSPNVWDDGYPSGGNYWSDYVGVDVKKGPSQDEPGSDSIGDTQYTVDWNNVDQFPLMYSYGSPPPPNYALTITTTVNGTTDPAPGTYLYSQGQSVPVQANPDSGYGLDHWELDGSNVSLNNSYSVLIDNNHTLLAVFVQINYTLWITASPGGTTDPAPGVYAYSSWSNVQVTAIADTDCVLYYWELDGLNIGATNPTNVTMDADHTLNAVFGLAHPPPAPSFWTVPSAVSFDTNNASVGTLFDVTVWGACLDHTYGCQIKMGWNPSLLQVVGVVTGDKDMTYGFNNVAGTLLADGWGVHGHYAKASMYSLFSVEFKVTAAPGVDQTLQCNIDPGYGIAEDWTYWLNTSLNEEIPLSTTPCAYTFAYAAPPPIHDVAVTNLTSAKTVIGQGFLGNLTATVQNQGNFTETVNVTAYANTTSIASQNVTLSSGASANVTLVWNATGFAKGNYTLSAYAWPVPGETNTANNNFTDGWVIVSIAGDIAGKNGLPDGRVDMKDIATVAAAFGSKPGDSNWNPNADINNDGKVDMKDIAMVAGQFGQKDP